jgi:hypothetical protein
MLPKSFFMIGSSFFAPYVSVRADPPCAKAARDVTLHDELSVDRCPCLRRIAAGHDRKGRAAAA